ncbi:uncharacterized protein BJ171DRAFT_491101 [Polychytrium aggregatum]|uniref:uncharacterized protein n=1 Tax=Polychytrium aggregatum TaxID=110093 RepID=UPI0022FE409E|nr:uncharacterized protein BJ171DRAFT_491101 [Polychytrium aggregatum]KAI9208363.1 hypothetical protein BJ171DRAFT_491101 [Polychytrium aggregatum]
MTSHREGIFIKGLWVDKSPLPEDIPHVDEVGLTSAPLASMSFFFATFCKDYSEDFMLCKKDNPDPKACLKEGRKVTRCAIDLIQKLKDNCEETWTKHWQCLDMNNQHFWQCRKEEAQLNDCVFKKLGLTKTIPETPEDQIPIHLKPNPLFK